VPVPIGSAGRPQVTQWAASGGGGGLGPTSPAAAAAAALEAAIGGLVAPRPGDSPLVDDWACLRRLADAWAGAGCGGGLSGTEAGSGPQGAAAALAVDQGGLRHAGVLARACNAGMEAGVVVGVLGRACGGGATVAAA
jgi:hypothetical protein